MPDIAVHRHGDRWAVAERGAESPVKEFPTREAAELAARQMAAGGAVEVTEEDPSGLEQPAPPDAGEPPDVDTGERAADGAAARDATLHPQTGL